MTRTAGRIPALLLGATTLAALTLSAAPATADAGGPLDTDPFGTASSPSTSGPWGSVDSADHRLRADCHRYPFQYRIDVPGDEWMAELTLVTPRGQRLVAKTLDSSSNPDRGTATWRVCGANTRPGVHTITLKVTSVDGREMTEQREKPTRFRFTAR